MVDFGREQDPLKTPVPRNDLFDIFQIGISGLRRVIEPGELVSWGRLPRMAVELREHGELRAPLEAIAEKAIDICSRGVPDGVESLRLQFDEILNPAPRTDGTIAQ